jgi:hypothetical protein
MRELKVALTLPQYAGCGAILCAPSGPLVVTRKSEPIAEYLL